jgi:hypothetical protein
MGTLFPLNTFNIPTCPHDPMLGNIECSHMVRVKAQNGAAKNVVTLYFFQGCPCLNFNHDNVGTYFLIFLHNMVDYNTKNSITKKIPFSNLYCEVPKYICGKKMYVIVYKYNQKMIKIIYNLYEICSIY